MNTFNSNLPKRRSLRLKGYDYASQGLYFITICCDRRRHLFGKIIDGVVQLNESGTVAEQCWLEIPQHFTNVILHEFVIMPNHIHGIIEISEGANQHSPGNDHNTTSGRMSDQHSTTETGNTQKITENESEMIYQLRAKNISHCKCDDDSLTRAKIVSHCKCDDDSPTRAKIVSHCKYDDDSPTRAKIVSPLRSPSNTIGSMIRGYKIGVTKWMRQNTDVYDVWQRNYYENIIRNEQSYLKISDYIKDNPGKWQNEKFYTK